MLGGGSIWKINTWWIWVCVWTMACTRRSYPRTDLLRRCRWVTGSFSLTSQARVCWRLEFLADRQQKDSRSTLRPTVKFFSQNWRVEQSWVCRRPEWRSSSVWRGGDVSCTIRGDPARSLKGPFHRLWSQMRNWAIPERRRCLWSTATWCHLSPVGSVCISDVSDATRNLS